MRPKKRAPAGARRAGAPGLRRNPLEVALASLAHEVRTPLNGILALAELLAASDLPERERGWARALKSAAEHLAGLTTVVVDGARAKTGRLELRQEPFDLSALAADLAQSLAARAAVKGLGTEVAIAPELPAQAVGDPVRLRAAVENLIDNAVKFSRAGGIRLAVTTEPIGEQRIRLALTVADEGIGLSKAELRRLFRPFRQAHAGVTARYGGAGLGLAFARSVARAMGGDVTVESVPGEGSTFRLTAVVEAASAQDAHPEGTARATRANAAPRVLYLLCAEDNPYGRVVLNTMAAALGHRIDFVESGEAVVAAVRNGNYDVVLMDVMLPGTDGMEATRRIRALPGAAGAIPIIGISGRGTTGEKAARAAGMNAYLVKPIGPGTLTAAIDAVVLREN